MKTPFEFESVIDADCEGPTTYQVVVLHVPDEQWPWWELKVRDATGRPVLVSDEVCDRLVDVAKTKI